VQDEWKHLNLLSLHFHCCFASQMQTHLGDKEERAHLKSSGCYHHIQQLSLAKTNLAMYWSLRVGGGGKVAHLCLSVLPVHHSSDKGSSFLGRPPAFEMVPGPAVQTFISGLG
jgi:hypothetical protein